MSFTDRELIRASQVAYSARLNDNNYAVNP